MKNITLLVLLVSLLLPFHVLAESTICTKDSHERRVEVASTDSSKTVPCEVRYFKDSGSEASVLWNAKNNAEYCQAKAKEFIGKLQSFGWTCGSTSSSKTSVSETSSMKEQSKRKSKTTSEVPTEIKETPKDVKTPQQATPKTDIQAPSDPTAPASAVEKKK